MWKILRLIVARTRASIHEEIYAHQVQFNHYHQLNADQTKTVAIYFIECAFCKKRFYTNDEIDRFVKFKNAEAAVINK